jgi:hypothetical protein
MLWTAALSAFWLGFFYFIAAIPAAVVLGMPAMLAGVIAIAGYSAGAGVVLLAGAPLLRWWKARRERKEAVKPIAQDSKKHIPLWKRAWNFGGLWFLGLVAPITIGPQVGALIATSLGEKPVRTWIALTAGILPWAVFFAVASLALK